MAETYVISFPDSSYAAVNVGLRNHLAELLTVQNSPVLFGCRTGICGTCLVKICGNVAPAKLDEQEMLETLAPGNTNVRLACQIALRGNVEIWRFEE
jgi:ferredoxin